MLCSIVDIDEEEQREDHFRSNRHTWLVHRICQACKLHRLTTSRRQNNNGTSKATLFLASKSTELLVDYFRCYNVKAPYEISRTHSALPPSNAIGQREQKVVKLWMLTSNLLMSQWSYWWLINIWYFPAEEDPQLLVPLPLKDDKKRATRSRDVYSRTWHCHDPNGNRWVNLSLLSSSTVQEKFLPSVPHGAPELSASLNISIEHSSSLHIQIKDVFNQVHSSFRWAGQAASQRVCTVDSDSWIWDWHHQGRGNRLLHHWWARQQLPLIRAVSTAAPGISDVEYERCFWLSYLPRSISSRRSREGKTGLLWVCFWSLAQRLSGAGQVTWTLTFDTAFVGLREGLREVWNWQGFPQRRWV